MATTYTTPIANDYLDLRAELGAALFSLTALALETDAPSETIGTLGNLQTALREPFLFVVVGEVKAGKSSLLNALFGKELCRVDVLPATDRVHVFKYGEQARDVPLHPDLVEHHQPVGFLRDFNIVDTPGTNTIVTQHQRITEQFAPLADLILFVFSVVNPWGASAWQFLEHLQRKWLKNVVFVVQQADLREEREVQAVVQHLKQKAAGRFGQAFPVFAVSAKKAFLSKTTGVDKARLWEESRLGPLEDYINEIVGTGEIRLEKLRSIDRTAQVILGDLVGGTRTDSLVVSADRAELDRLRAAIAQHRGRADLGVEAFLRGIDTAFSRCQHQGEHLLSQKLRPGAAPGLAFGKSDRWRHHFQRNSESMLHAAVSRQMEHAFDLLEGELRSVWTQLSESLRANLSPGARERLADSTVDFAEQRPRLTEKIEVATVESLTDDRTENELQTSFAEVAAAVRGRWWAGLLLLLAGGALLGTGVVPAWVGCALAALAVVAILLGFGVASSGRRRIVEAYRAQIRERQAELGGTVAGLIRQAVDAFFGKVEQVYAPLEAFCQGRGAAHQPLLERADTLEKAFRKIAARL